MATSNSFQLGLLPERKIDRRALAASYGFVVLLIIICLNIGLIWPDHLTLGRKYHVTELIPLPSLQPPPLKLKQPPKIVRAKLLPPAPVFAAPKLIVPREVHATRRTEEIQPPKVVMNNFNPAVLKPVSGGARPSLIVHTGEFGSSATPTINAPDTKGADWRLWRSQRNQGTRQRKRPSGRGQHRLVRPADRSRNGKRRGRSEWSKRNNRQRRFRKRNCSSWSGRWPQQWPGQRPDLGLCRAAIVPTWHSNPAAQQRTSNDTG